LDSIADVGRGGFRPRGKSVVRFERKVGARAESLDCLIYGAAARAALQLTPAAFDQRAGDLAIAAESKPAPLPVIRSKWMERPTRGW
jgi:hypothetical protein